MPSARVAESYNWHSSVAAEQSPIWPRIFSINTIWTWRCSCLSLERSITPRHLCMSTGIKHLHFLPMLHYHLCIAPAEKHHGEPDLPFFASTTSCARHYYPLGVNIGRWFLSVFKIKRHGILGSRPQPTESRFILCIKLCGCYRSLIPHDFLWKWWRA